jgi:hypothetical protein
MERFTRLLPDRADGLTAADVAAAVPGPAPDERPFLLVNMIATADGRATIAGRTGRSPTAPTTSCSTRCAPARTP